MSFSLIAAMDINRVIGIENRLPWHLPIDMRRFREITRGHTVVMGRKTYESIGKPLPNRHNVVLTRDRHFTADGCTVVHDIADVLGMDQEPAEIIIIGGAQIYRRTLRLATKLYLTYIDASFEGTETFPCIDSDDWQETDRIEHPVDEKNAYACTFVTLVRVVANPAR